MSEENPSHHSKPSSSSSSSGLVKSSLELDEDDDQGFQPSIFERSNQNAPMGVYPAGHKTFQLPPLDEEDEDHLFQNMGLLTDQAVSSIINGNRSPDTGFGVAMFGDHNVPNNDFCSIRPNSPEKEPDTDQSPRRSWTIKLQPSRSYESSSSLSLSSTNSVTGQASSSSSNKNHNNNHSLPRPFAALKQAIMTQMDISAFQNPMITEENFNFSSVEHADTSFPVFLELWQNEQVCDVTIVVGERK